jgi:NAD(P)-dependent dehydrogenase (short-subunit alcohol dehydrogenase family)
VTDTVRIGYGAAEAFLDAGAHVTIISSSAERVKEAVARLNSPNVKGAHVDVRDEEAFVQVLRSTGPVDHIVYSAVDKIIRGRLEDVDIDEAKYLFGVKFWGSIILGKGECRNHQTHAAADSISFQPLRSTTLSNPVDLSP